MIFRFLGMSLRFSKLWLLASLTFVLPSAVAAQTQATPVPIVVPTAPPGILNDPRLGAAAGLATQIYNAVRARVQNGTHGTVVYYRGFELQIQTGSNAYRNVHLHRGTEIDPRGVGLAPGMTVDVGGHARDDGSLDADIITVDQ